MITNEILLPKGQQNRKTVLVEQENGVYRCIIRSTIWKINKNEFLYLKATAIDIMPCITIAHQEDKVCAVSANARRRIETDKTFGTPMKENR